jgi:hypothetical protein
MSKKNTKESWTKNLSQRISYKEKTENDYAWARAYMDHIIQYFGPFSGNSYDNYKRKLANYRFFNNELEYEDVAYECSLLNIDKNTFNDIIQPFVWVHNVIDVLIGENNNRPFNHRVILINSEGVKSYNRQKTKLLNDYLEQMINQEIEQYKLEEMENNPPEFTGDEEQDAQIQEEYEMQLQQQVDKLQKRRVFMDPDAIEKYMLTWQDEREIAANKLLMYYKNKLEIKSLKSDGFKHGKIVGEEYAWVGIVNDEPVIKLLNPLNVFYHKSPDIKFIQYGDYAGYISYMSIGEVLSTFDLTEEDAAKLEGYTTLRSSYGMDVKMSSPQQQFRNKPFEMRFLRGSYADENATVGAYGQGNLEELVKVVHVEWRSKRKVGFVEYVDEFGEPQEEMVSEDFIIPKDHKKEVDKSKYGLPVTYYYFYNEVFGEVKLCWKWIDEIWEGTLIDEDIYLNIRPKELQYRELENPNSVKLGYHGVVYNNLNSSPVSTLDRAKPFNLLYIVVAHKMKHMIALDKPPILNIDVDEIPDNLDKKDFIHFMDTMGIKFTQRLKHADNPAAANLMATSSGQTQDRSTLQHILNYYQVLNLLKQDMFSIAGVAPERMAQSSHQQSVTNAQQNLTQSAHITDYEFKIHNLHWSKLLNSLVETAIYHLVTTKKKLVKRFILEDSTVASLEIDPEQYTNVDLGLFTTDTGKEHDIFEHLKQMTQALIQNDKISLSILTKMLEADSLSELKKHINEYEINKQKLEENMAAMEREHQQTMQEAEIESREDQQQHEIDLQHMKNEVEIYKAQLNALRFKEGLTPSEIQGFVDSEQKRELEYQIAEEDRVAEQQSKHQDRLLKMREMDHKEKIEMIKADAKLKAEKIKLANPVVGEKSTPISKSFARKVKPGVPGK